jgi:membrane dipeptidase
MPRENPIPALVALLSAVLSILFLGPIPMTGQSTQTAISEKALQLHFSSIVIDTHADTTQRFIDGDFDLAPRNEKGSVDIPRMREGGLDAIFFSIWMPSKVRGPIAVQRAQAQIDAVHTQVKNHSADLVFATSANEIRAARGQNKITILLGVEGGRMINRNSPPKASAT